MLMKRQGNDDRFLHAASSVDDVKLVKRPPELSALVNATNNQVCTPLLHRYPTTGLCHPRGCL
ncbi:hypothetical protein SAMD00023353_1401720 [Rosellinia necatrix]|uniref:Uncharacterized protein n=1 Tax=Rosellinia necatrix TaxID=77044 RepID=A0A1S8A7F7_ROSNE|nr:hypothetical protein SAMD00023353_1401720 [Rosellinia necatrix]